METKMTSRDKVLLIVLAFIIVIFGAVMIPTYGIKDYIISITETNAQIKEQTKTNEDILKTMTDSNIPATYAEVPGNAKGYFKTAILKSKNETAKIQQTSLSENSYSVADNWLLPIAYLRYDAGNPTLYTKVEIKNNENAFSDNEINIEDNVFETEVYSCLLTCVSSEIERYNLELQYLTDGEKVDDLSLLIYTYNALQERGSIVVTGWTIDGAAISLELSLVIPKDSDVSKYKAEIRECHNCGKPYYLSDYNAALKALDEGETQVKCTDCEKPLTGE